eukprot:TRINITY_DN15498_c0_g1_i2.p2 TRINITY_DN15498_c0_g1~~TRINITY_DN15498_c0_g1_i2.p2  ORF type:complete len:111 (-),score=26.05 TRINITY_DN15498_c0_g1_i2:103-435(-)
MSYINGSCESTQLGNRFLGEFYFLLERPELMPGRRVREPALVRALLLPLLLVLVGLTTPGKRAPPLPLTTWQSDCPAEVLSLIHISEPTRLLSISYAVFCLKKKKKKQQK